MTAPWLSYVPWHVADDILRYPGESPVGRERRFDAVALFADVSGFTVMSEALGKYGKSGTEELTTILNSYFGPMIELIESYGGVVGKFGGDAVTVLFPYTSPTQGIAISRSIQCALEMQANMHRYAAIPTSAGPFSLAMKAGLAMGSVICTSVGDPAIRVEYIIAGGVLDRCADAEHHATKGDVVVHNALMRYGSAVDVAEQRGDFSRVSGMLCPVETAPLSRREEILESSLSTLAAYLHPAIAQRIRAGQLGFINEHRKVTVLFVRFDGFNYDSDPQVSARLQHYLGAVIHIVHRYDGYLNKVDMGDKGSKYIVLFGTPVAHENDEERALRCALDLIALPDIPARIGVNTGVVYCGQVGSEARQEYTVMGDPVNLAARLMQATAPGQILVTGLTQRHVTEAFTWERREPIMVKGKAEPIPVHVVKGYAGRGAIHLLEPSYHLPMVGRERELQQAIELIERARGGRGHLLGITGEAGLGKSRLNAEVIKLATNGGLVAYAGACQSYGTNMSYLVWQSIWQGFFDIDPAAPLETVTSRLQTQLAEIDVGLVQRMPLLGPALGLALPDNDVTRTLDPQLRTELLRALLLRCLRHRARAMPMLLVLEDAHWIDALSGDLLEFIARNLVDLPILLVGLYRPHEGRYGVLQRLVPLAHAREIRLKDFVHEEVRQLIALKLEHDWGTSDGVSPALAERITDKAQGNPFYIEELINYIHDRGIEPQDTAAIEAIELPDSLQSLIISRIDQLEEDEKTTLKVASVIGRVFKAAWLWGSYPEVGTPEQVRQRLETLRRLDLTPLDKPEPEFEYLFKHITTQEVAYESLTFGLRAMLHESVGNFVEQVYAERLDRQLDVLALHYGRSRNTDKQIVYFRRAGDAAKAGYANQAAIDYYRRLLPLLPEAEQSDVMRELGEVLQLIGRWPEADKLYRDALARAQPASISHAECQCALGNLLSYTQTYEEALTWLIQAKEAFEQLGFQTGMGRTLKWLSFVYFEKGRFADSLTCSEQYLRLASEARDQVGVSEALTKIGTVYQLQGKFSDALAYLRQASEVADAIGYQRGLIHSAISTAGVYWQQDDYPRALACLQQALTVATMIGHLHASALIVGNAGILYGQQGQSSYALACYQRALAIAAELGDQAGICLNVGNMAEVLGTQKRFREAERLYSHAIALGQRLEASYLSCYVFHHKANLLHRLERHSEAQLINQQALQIAAAVDRREVQFPAQVLAIRLRVALEQTDTATAINELEQLADAWTDESEQAAIQYAIWRVDGAQETSRRTAAEVYRRLYEQTPNIEYRERYAELTGETLPEPPPLPPLPESVMGEPVDLRVLLERVGVEL